MELASASGEVLKRKLRGDFFRWLKLLWLNPSGQGDYNISKNQGSVGSCVRNWEKYSFQPLKEMA